MLKHKAVWFALCLIALVSVYLWVAMEETAPEVSVTATELSPVVNQQVLSSPMIEKAPVAKTVKAVQTLENTDNEARGILPGEVESKFKETMKVQLNQVARAYEQNMRYPPYSIPLSEESWDLKHPRAFVTNQLPVRGSDGVTAAIHLKDYVVFEGQPFQIDLAIESNKVMPALYDLKVEILEDYQPLVQLAMRQVDQSDHKIQYQGNYQPTPEQSASWGLDLQIRATLSMGQGETVLISPVKYSHRNAVLTGADTSYPQGTDLVIPLRFEVIQAGRYQVRANLYDAQGQSLSHLVMKGNLTPESPLLSLRVHSQILRDQNAQGPYLLKEFNITKVPIRPGDKTGFALSELEEIPVQGFPLDSYDDEPYENSADQERLAFLKQLAE